MSENAKPDLRLTVSLVVIASLKGLEIYLCDAHGPEWAVKKPFWYEDIRLSGHRHALSYLSSV
jgi:hypothetical protein